MNSTEASPLARRAKFAIIPSSLIFIAYFAVSTFKTDAPSASLRKSEPSLRRRLDPERWPDLAWLVSYPNSGSEYTTHLVESASRTTMATNYGTELGDRYKDIPLVGQSPEGPFRYNIMPLPQTLILTKTHCAGYCLTCGVEKHVMDDEGFLNGCSMGHHLLNDQGMSMSHYNPSAVKKIVHAIRDPFDNIVARYHHQREFARNYDSSWMYSYGRKGFLLWCKETDRRFAETDDRWTSNPDIAALADQIPCHGIFTQYVIWHNSAFNIAEKNGIPEIVIHYKDFRDNLEELTDAILKFLDLPTAGEASPINFQAYSTYFTDEERMAIGSFIKTFSSAPTWENLKIYFPEVDAESVIHFAPLSALFSQSLGPPGLKIANEDVSFPDNAIPTNNVGQDGPLPQMGAEGPIPGQDEPPPQTDGQIPEGPIPGQDGPPPPMDGQMNEGPIPGQDGPPPPPMDGQMNEGPIPGQDGPPPQMDGQIPEGPIPGQDGPPPQMDGQIPEGPIPGQDGPPPQMDGQIPEGPIAGQDGPPPQIDGQIPEGPIPGQDGPPPPMDTKVLEGLIKIPGPPPPKSRPDVPEAKPKEKPTQASEPEETDDHAGPWPKLAWLMSFTNHELSKMGWLLTETSKTTVATNYGNEVPPTLNLPDNAYSKDGPFRVSGDPFPLEFIASKTTCVQATIGIDSRRKYAVSTDHFIKQCSSGISGVKKVEHKKEIFKKIVHLARNPYDNIVGLFHLAYRMNKKNISWRHSYNTQGFKSWCEELDKKHENDNHRYYSKDQFQVSKLVPCHGEFYKYVMWHNNVVDITDQYDVPVLLVDYDDVKPELFEFLGLPIKNPDVKLASMNFPEYFTDSERGSIAAFIKLLCTKKSCGVLEKFFPHG